MIKEFERLQQQAAGWYGSPEQPTRRNPRRAARPEQYDSGYQTGAVVDRSTRWSSPRKAAPSTHAPSYDDHDYDTPVYGGPVDVSYSPIETSLPPPVQAPVQRAITQLRREFGRDPKRVVFGTVTLMMSALLPMVGALIGYSSITHRPDEIKANMCASGVKNFLFRGVNWSVNSPVVRLLSWSAPFIPFAMALVPCIIKGIQTYKGEIEGGRLGDNISLKVHVECLYEHISTSGIRRLPWKRLAFTVGLVALAALTPALASLTPFAMLLGDGLSSEVVRQTALGIAMAVGGSMAVCQKNKPVTYVICGLSALMGVASAVFLSHSAHYCYRAADTSDALIWTTIGALSSAAMVGGKVLLAKFMASPEVDEDQEYSAWCAVRTANAHPDAAVLDPFTEEYVHPVNA